jgi:hypothetical protein
VTLECECGGLLRVYSFADVSDWKDEVFKWTYGRSAHCPNGNHSFHPTRLVCVLEI